MLTNCVGTVLQLLSSNVPSLFRKDNSCLHNAKPIKEWLDEFLDEVKWLVFPVKCLKHHCTFHWRTRKMFWRPTTWFWYIACCFHYFLHYRQAHPWGKKSEHWWECVYELQRFHKSIRHDRQLEVKSADLIWWLTAPL